MKRSRSRVVNTCDSVRYANIMKIMPWGFSWDKNYKSLLFIWEERRSKQNMSNKRRLGCLVSFILFYFLPILASALETITWLFLRKTEVRPMNTPHFDVCTCGKISGHTSPTESGGKSPAHIQRRLTCSNIHFPLLTNLTTFAYSSTW